MTEERVPNRLGETGVEDQYLARLLHTPAVGTTRRGWRCPHATKIAAFVEGRLDGRAMKRIETHVAGCNFCLGQVAFLARIQQNSMPTEVPEKLFNQALKLGSRTRDSAGGPAWRWGFATAASAVLVLAFAVFLHEPSRPTVSSQPPRAPAVEPLQSRPSQPTVPSPDSSGVRSRQSRALLPELVYPREGVILAPRDVEFRWRQMPGSLFYEIRVMTFNGDVIWEERSEETHARLPESVRLSPGGNYFVSVRAYLSRGKTARSLTVGFKVRNPG